jgi:hypothetical protein
MEKNKEILPPIHLETRLDEKERADIQRLLQAEREPLQPGVFLGGYHRSFARGGKQLNYLRILPSKHSCGTIYEERAVPVDEKVLSLNPYPVNYCPKCGVHVFGNPEIREQLEFDDPVQAGGYVTFLQMRTNLQGDKVPYSILKKAPKP